MLQNEQTEHVRRKAPFYSYCVATLTFGRLFLFPNAPYGASGALHTPKAYVFFWGPRKAERLYGEEEQPSKKFKFAKLKYIAKVVTKR